jgi:DNA-binding NarL/FixJ family response regulator
VLDKDVLLKRAFAGLLSLGNDVAIIVSEAEDLQELINDIQKTNPDAVLLSESMPFSRQDVLSQLLMFQPVHKLIVVSEENNSLSVFSREERLITELSDLLVFINAA